MLIPPLHPAETGLEIPRLDAVTSRVKSCRSADLPPDPRPGQTHYSVIPFPPWRAGRARARKIRLSSGVPPSDSRICPPTFSLRSSDRLVSPRAPLTRGEPAGHAA